MFSFVLMIVGAFIGMFGTIMVIMAAFSKSAGWGVFSILPFGDIIFGMVEWDEARMGLAMKLLGFALVGAGLWVGIDGVVSEVIETREIPFISTTLLNKEEKPRDGEGAIAEEVISAKEQEAMEIARTAPPQTGKTMQEVTATLGPPNRGSGMSGTQTLWFYHRRTVTFENGVVIADERYTK